MPFFRFVKWVPRHLLAPCLRYEKVYTIFEVEYDQTNVDRIFDVMSREEFQSRYSSNISE